MALADAPLSLPLGRMVQLPLLRELQREARQPNARGRLSLNKTPMIHPARTLTLRRYATDLLREAQYPQEFVKKK